MYTEDKRDFKGVWIPKEIWLNKELTMTEKVIYIEIDSLDNENHCTASNEYLANFCGCSISKVSKSIKKLQDLKMIEVTEFNGRNRKINLVKNARQPSKKYEAASQKMTAINIDNKKDIEKQKDKSKTALFKPNSINKTSLAECDEFVNLYHQYCTNLPKVRQLTDKRKKAIQNILDKYTLNEITEVFKSANESDFLIGNNDRGWKADIDFLLREDKFLNILEGKYGGKKKRAFKEVGVNAHVQSVTEKDKERMNEFKKELERKGLPTQF